MTQLGRGSSLPEATATEQAKHLGLTAHLSPDFR